MMHEVDLGEALSEAELLGRIAMVEPELLDALMQMIRNEAGQYEIDAHDDRAAGKADKATLEQGAAQGLRSLFMDLLKKRRRVDRVDKLDTAADEDDDGEE